MRRCCAAAVVILSWASVGYGQQPVDVQFTDGLVTLHARNATVRQVLAEWARVGRATIVNGDAITGGPVTLELAGVPEAQALKILLRNVSGYVVAARDRSVAGASAFDRVVVLPSSAAPRPAAVSSPPPPAVFGPAQPQSAPMGFRAAQPQPDITTGEFPEPDMVPAVIESPKEAPGAPTPGAVAMPSNPFGLTSGATARPGMIATPPPQPPAMRSPSESTERK